MSEIKGRQMTERNMLRFKRYIKLAKENRLKQNQEVCGFLFLCPINKRKSTNVYIYGMHVANIENSDIELIKNLDKKTWENNEWKKNVFYNTVNEFFPKDEEVKIINKKPIKKKDGKKSSKN